MAAPFSGEAGPERVGGIALAVRTLFYVLT